MKKPAAVAAVAFGGLLPLAVWRNTENASGGLAAIMKRPLAVCGRASGGLAQR